MSTIPETFKRFALSGLYDHQPAPPNTVVAGSFDEVMSNVPGTRQQADAMQRAEDILGRVEAAEAEQAITHAGQVAILNDIVDGLVRRVDAFVQRRDEQARKDAEQAEREEQQRIDTELAALPDPDAPWDPDDPNYAPGGLTPTGPTTPEHERRLAAIEDEDEHQDQHQGEDVIEDNHVTAPNDDQGALPEELVKKAPPEQGNTAITSMKLKDPASFGYPSDPPEQQQPVAVSLNTEEDD